MDSRRHSATRVAAAVAQEAINTLMSSSADHDFELSLQSYTKNGTKDGIQAEANTSTDKITVNGLKSTHKSMYDSYQVWALKTYGDSAKTKTVTKKKYNRILKILKGEEGQNVENSKFRFWVKAKGFRLGPPNLAALQAKSTVEQVLYVPCSKSAQGSDSENTIYKKVAVVENFFDIIYNVHVEMDGRSGRHAGQKRTYKAVAEMYAFLPREAVTRFLMSCSDCQKRMHLQSTNGSTNGMTAQSKTSSSKSTSMRKSLLNTNLVDGLPKTALDIDYSLPLTTTIKRMRNAGFVYNVMGDSLIAPTVPSLGFDGQEGDDEMISETETGASDADISAHNGDQTTAANSDDAVCEEITGDDDDEEVVDETDFDEEAVPLDMSRVKRETCISSDQPLNMCSKRAKLSNTCKSIINGNDSGSGADFHNKHHSSTSHISHGFTERWNHKTKRELHEDEEDDDDEDNDLQLGDRLLSEQSTGSYDPERLKAFNMFVRLFVDENLDRMVPISRQPKEKIQAIIESCGRQFPEFSERARKRIRTYLKSCRRTKRHKTTAQTVASGNENGNNGRAWSESSNTNTNTKTGPSSHVSYHLTSPMAEQILATACDNECQNAKRMRMGLKPISNEVSSTSTGTTSAPVHCTATSTSASAVQVFQQSSTTNPNLLSFSYQQQSIASENNTSNGTTNLVNGNSVTGSVSSNGKPSTTGTHYSLNPSEVAAVKQLIAGYRESAAFLLRSADELEQLILQQN
ncbi:nucleolar protein 4-like [Oppia nitens]|uniref:nucleolar protein 4-like n=1 Tax=Oppia nitens TaxID=1686743 RepID=UPI0023DBB204|nr:nucleolar protein 4-like [Oppia nitens]